MPKRMTMLVVGLVVGLLAGSYLGWRAASGRRQHELWPAPREEGGAGPGVGKAWALAHLGRERVLRAFDQVLPGGFGRAA